ncbi:MAG: hypothetical protein ACO27N_09830, partial [Bacteroidia bacterium]
LPESLDNVPFAEFVRRGFTALFKVDFKDAEPLLDELLLCAEIVTKAGVRKLILNDDFEDPRTLLLLRKEIFALHTDFFTDD